MPKKEKINSSDLILRFSGKRVNEGKMKVDEFCKTLGAMEVLLKAANEELHGSKAKIDVNIKAPSKGSFKVYFDIVPLSKKQSDFSLDTNNIQYLLDQLFRDEQGLFELINFLQGNALTKENIKKTGEIIDIEMGEYNFKTNQQVLRLFMKKSVRQSAWDLVTILHKEGISEMEFIRFETNSIKVKENDVEYFRHRTLENDDTHSRDVILEIITLSFKENGKWSVKEEGGKPFNVEITDPGFLKDINNNEKFSKNDYLSCKLLEERVDKDGKIVEKRAITKVYDHIPAEEYEYISAEEQAEMFNKE